jgi:hypothetical protein
MSVEAYIEALPFHEIIRHPGGNPLNSVAFSGVPRKHPYDPDKFILFGDPLGADPSIVEFKMGDIVKAEQLPSPVTKEGESLFLVRVWVRRGALAMQYRPFEVDEPPLYMKDSQKLKEHFSEGLFRTGE